MNVSGMPERVGRCTIRPGWPCTGAAGTEREESGMHSIVENTPCAAPISDHRHGRSSTA